MTKGSSSGSDIIVLSAENQHIPVIQEIAFKTWPSAYQKILGDPQVEYMLEKMYDMKVLESQMHNGHIFLIAHYNQAVIGFASFSLITEKTGKLHKLYVLPEMQQSGAGKKLLCEVENELKKNHAEKLQLNVNRNNKAKHFYEKQGFTVIAQEDIDIGNGYFMNDYIMEKQLVDEE